MSGCAVWMGSLGETSTQASPDLQLVDCGVSWHVCTLKARELSQSGGRRWFEMGVLQWVLEGGNQVLCHKEEVTEDARKYFVLICFQYRLELDCFDFC